jgi:putative spermidine/putrescine transport system permease protein
MKRSRLGPWLALAIGTAYFLIPLIATFEFSLRLRRGEYSFDAYRVVLADPKFQAAFGYSTLIALATIALGVLLVVPTAYWIELRLRRLRRWSSSSRSCPSSSRRSSSCSAICTPIIRPR